MKQVIEQNFQLDGIPQAPPRATEDSVQEFPPQLTEGRLNPLPHLTEQELLRRGAVPRNQQHLCVLRQAGSTLGATIPQVAEGDPALDALDQSQRRVSVIPGAGRQDQVQDASVDVPQHVQLEAKEPSLASFAKVRALVPQQPYPPVPDRLTEGNGLTVNQIQSGGCQGVATGGAQQLPHQRAQVMQAADPLFVRGQLGESCPPILRHQAIGLLEGGHFEDASQQGHGQHFSVAELRLGVGRPTPLGQARMAFAELIDKAVDRGHVVVYALHHRASVLRGGIKGDASILYLRWTDALTVSTQDWGSLSDTALALRTSESRRSAGLLPGAPAARSRAGGAQSRVAAGRCCV